MPAHSAGHGLTIDGEGEIDLPSWGIRGLYMEDQCGVLDVPLTNLLPEEELSSSLLAE
jgi:hypothetical protein